MCIWWRHPSGGDVVVPAGYAVPHWRRPKHVTGYVVYNTFTYVHMHWLPVPVAARSKAWVWGRSLAGIAGSNPTGNMDVCLLWVLSGRRLCDELITRPGESYWVWSVWVWSWSLDNKDTLAHWGPVAPWQKKYALVGLFLIMNDQCMVMNHLKFCFILRNFKDTKWNFVFFGVPALNIIFSWHSYTLPV